MRRSAGQTHADPLITPGGKFVEGDDDVLRMIVGDTIEELRLTRMPAANAGVPVPIERYGTVAPKRRSEDDTP